MAEFKKGDKVRFADTTDSRTLHDIMPDSFPAPGTMGVVAADGGDCTTMVRWADGSVRGPDYIWHASNSLLEPVKDAAPDYYIRVTATSEDGAQVEVNGPVDWVHEALAQAIMKLNPEDPFGVLVSVLTRALDVEDGDDDE